MPSNPTHAGKAVSYLQEIDLIDTQKALLNILDDYSEEKFHSENTQRALLNILEDFSDEKRNSDDTQKALLNILDDYRTEKENMEDTQRAFLNILEDYSAEKKKAESSNESLLAANIENKELEQFAFVASHDLQEPLRTITNFVGLLEEKYVGIADEETQLYLTFIVNAAAKMQSLIRDLLELSRIGTDAVFTPVDYTLVAQAALADLAQSIAESGAIITLSPLPVLLGNEAELKRLFLNLISNAIKFRRKNVVPQIAIKADEQEDSWLFSIEDNGIGIDEKYREKIFIIFQRLHTVEEYSGTGIGLATCKKIVSLHKGKLSVDSTVGAGSIFQFSIPKGDFN